METNIEDIEIEIKLLFLDEGENAHTGLKLLIETYTPILTGYILKNHPIPLESIKDILSEVFSNIWKMVQKGSFKEDGSLNSLLITVTKRRIFDLYRKQKRMVITDNITLDLIESTEGTNARFEWDLMCIRMDKAVIREKFVEFILTLPSVQRKVANGILTLYQNDLTSRDIFDYLVQIGEEDITIASINSARKQIREKFKLFIKDLEL